ncbi:hypothetical protein FXF65_18665 [Actinomadura syzygii]|uniref:Uncharacterized protein n=1 Tax=Actinomadura syzygii TaxID=1427538 RepID=A0A5D0U4Z2_9ACTN|nr:hypothetical protein FXF65_18665 [Actinomadura syzygii]
MSFGAVCTTGTGNSVAARARRTRSAVVVGAAWSGAGPPGAGTKPCASSGVSPSGGGGRTGPPPPELPPVPPPPPPPEPGTRMTTLQVPPVPVLWQGAACAGTAVDKGMANAVAVMVAAAARRRKRGCGGIACPSLPVVSMDGP